MSNITFPNSLHHHHHPPQTSRNVKLWPVKIPAVNFTSTTISMPKASVLVTSIWDEPISCDTVPCLPLINSRDRNSWTDALPFPPPGNGRAHILECAKSWVNRSYESPRIHLFVFFIRCRIVGYFVLLEIYYFLHFIVVAFSFTYNHCQVE